MQAFIIRVCSRCRLSDAVCVCVSRLSGGFPTLWRQGFLLPRHTSAMCTCRQRLIDIPVSSVGHQHAVRLSTPPPLLFVAYVKKRYAIDLWCRSPASLARLQLCDFSKASWVSDRPVVHMRCYVTHHAGSTSLHLFQSVPMAQAPCVSCVLQQMTKFVASCIFRAGVLNPVSCIIRWRRIPALQFPAQSGYCLYSLRDF